MKIKHRDGRILETHCRGCMCHDMAMIFGDGPKCAECGCPHTLAEFDRQYTAQEAIDAVRTSVPTGETTDE